MTNTEHNETIIKRLLDLWYSIIGADHHKDRDCWFFIERDYCTYSQPSWSVNHRGYILGDHNESFETFEKAQEGLIEFLTESCAKEIDCIRNNINEYFPQINEAYVNAKTEELEKIVIDQHYISEKV
jgi:hypothetical protein